MCVCVVMLYSYGFCVQINLPSKNERRGLKMFLAWLLARVCAVGAAAALLVWWCCSGASDVVSEELLARHGLEVDWFSNVLSSECVAALLVLCCGGRDHSARRNSCDGRWVQNKTSKTRTHVRTHTRAIEGERVRDECNVRMRCTDDAINMHNVHGTCLLLRLASPSFLSNINLMLFLFKYVLHVCVCVFVRPRVATFSRTYMCGRWTLRRSNQWSTTTMR